MNRSLTANQSAFALASLAAIGALTSCTGRTAEDMAADSPEIYTVQQADLVVSIREKAEIQAERETRVRSEVEGQAQVIKLITEGKQVKAGDVLIELDVSDLEDRKANQAITVSRAQASLLSARKDFEILGKELIAEERSAESKLLIAEMSLEKFLGALPKNARAANRAASRDVATNGALSKEAMIGAMGDSAVASDEANGRGDDVTSPRSATVDLKGNKPEPTMEDSESATTVLAGASTEDAIAIAVEGTNAEVIDRLLRLLSDEEDGGGKKGSVVRELALGIQLLLGASDAETATNMERDLGAMANRVLQQIDQIDLARADLKIKEDTLGHSERLAGLNFITQNELERDRLDNKSQKSKVSLAWNDLELLVHYELQTDLITLRQDVANSSLELERVRASNDARRANKESDVAAMQQEYDLALERLNNLESQIKNAVIRAPTPGIVVYATQGDGRRGREVVEEGQMVRERQSLIVLPDLTTMVAELKIQEADIDKVQIGQPATIVLETSGGESVTGRVVYKAPLPDSGSRWSNNDRKVYKVRVQVDGSNGTGILRPNMSSDVTIFVMRIEDTLPVPLQAVSRDRYVNYLWKATADGPKAVRIEVGEANATHVSVTEGIANGDRVYLAVPAGVELPKFAQPERKSLQPEDIPTERVPSPADSGAGKGKGKVAAEENAQGADPRAEMEAISAKIRAVLIKDLPDRASEFEGMGLMRLLRSDPDVKAAYEKHPDLQEEMQAVFTRMRESGGFGGGQRGSGGGQRGSGGGRGSRGNG